ncbi:response regulator [Streptomyces mauvecolor]
MLSVALVDDEELVRVGLRSILESDPEIKVVAEADDGRGALDIVRRHHVDVLAMDLNMPGLDGLGVLKELRHSPDTPPVLFLTSFGAGGQVYDALEAGASGFVLKGDSPGELLRHVHAVADGHAAVSSPVLRCLMRSALARRDDTLGPTARNRIESLSNREHEVFVLLGDGLSNADMAQQLLMSEGTMKSYVSRVLAKLKVSNRTQGALLSAQFTRWRRDSA